MIIDSLTLLPYFIPFVALHLAFFLLGRNYQLRKCLQHLEQWQSVWDSNADEYVQDIQWHSSEKK